jgi:hypothetical protein
VAEYPDQAAHLGDATKSGTFKFKGHWEGRTGGKANGVFEIESFLYDEVSSVSLGVGWSFWFPEPATRRSLRWQRGFLRKGEGGFFIS